MEPPLFAEVNLGVFPAAFPLRPQGFSNLSQQYIGIVPDNRRISYPQYDDALELAGNDPLVRSSAST